MDTRGIYKANARILQNIIKNKWKNAIAKSLLFGTSFIILLVAISNTKLCVLETGSCIDTLRHSGVPMLQYPHPAGCM